MEYCEEKRWYALRIRTKWSNKVEQSLGNKKFVTFNPTYQELSKRKDRKKLLRKPIFAGYLFIQTELNVDLHLEILKTYGVIDILKNEQGPISIPEDQIEKVRLLEEHVEKSVSLPDFSPGENVKIISGPLAGLKGVVDQVYKKRLRIYLQSIPSSINIEIDPLHLKSLEKTTLYQSVTG